MATLENYGANGAPQGDSYYYNYNTNSSTNNNYFEFPKILDLAPYLESTDTPVDKDKDSKKQADKKKKKAAAAA